MGLCVGLLLPAAFRAAAEPPVVPKAKQVAARVQRANLDLTPAQGQALSGLEQDSRAEAERSKTLIKQLRKQLDAEYRAYNLNLSRIGALHRQINAAQANLLNLHLASQRRLREILSAQQFAALHASLHEEEDEERGRPAGPPPGLRPPGFQNKSRKSPPGWQKNGPRWIPPGLRNKQNPFRKP